MAKRNKKHKTWAELTRGQRRAVRAFLRDDAESILDGSVPGKNEVWEQRWVEGIHAAVRELREPKR